MASSVEFEIVAFSDADHDLLRGAVMGVVASIPACARCKDGGRVIPATHVSVLDRQPVCEDHTCVGDTKMLDRAAVRRLLAVLAT